MAFSEDASLLSVSSDKATVHIFKLEVVNQAPAPAANGGMMDYFSVSHLPALFPARPGRTRARVPCKGVARRQVAAGGGRVLAPRPPMLRCRLPCWAGHVSEGRAVSLTLQGRRQRHVPDAALSGYSCLGGRAPSPAPHRASAKASCQSRCRTYGKGSATLRRQRSQTPGRLTCAH